MSPEDTTDTEVDAMNERLRAQVTAAETRMKDLQAACRLGDRRKLRQTADMAIELATFAEGIHHTLARLAEHLEKEEDR
ncbi:hypothetical protein [Nesterenkonia suensis]